MLGSRAHVAIVLGTKKFDLTGSFSLLVMPQQDQVHTVSFCVGFDQVHFVDVYLVKELHS